MNSVSVLTPRVIRASAGTGKTRELSSRYIGLLAFGESPDRILATTFTRKAAAEIRHRVFSRLAEAARSEERAHELGECFGKPRFSSAEALSVLQKLVAHQHRLMITTLDGFFGSIARSFALELGLPAEWRIASNSDHELMVNDAVRKLFEENNRAVSLELVRALHGGTHRSVHERVVSDVQKLYELFLFSPESAWRWIRLPLHAVGASWDTIVAAIEALEPAYNKDKTPDGKWQTAIDVIKRSTRNRDWKSLVKSSLVEKLLDGEDAFNKKEIPRQLRESVAEVLEVARRDLRATLHLRLGALYRMLSLYHDVYERTQRQLGVLGFSDVKHHLARSSIMGELDQVYYRLDTRIGHLLLDEFQDTSMTEWRVIQPIAAEILSQNDTQSFFCVGDVKQAIYGWRGGVAEIFETIESQWSHVSVESNQTTYRCAPAIVDFANQLFAAIPALPLLENYHSDVARWCERFQTHRAARSDLEGEVVLERTPEDVSPIERTVETAIDLHRRYPQATIGILVRKNSVISEILNAFSLAQEEIEVSEEGGNSLADSPCVRLILSAMTVLEHPSNSLSMHHLIECRFAEFLHVPTNGDVSAQIEWREQLRTQLLCDGYGETISRWVQKIRSHCGARDRIRLEQLVDLGYRFDSSRTLSTDDFRSFVESEKIELPSEARVRVMTVHQSKGLEFDIVIAADFGRMMKLDPDLLVDRPDPLAAPERIVPKTRSFERQLLPEFSTMYQATVGRMVSDELSVLYVALTRARHALYIIVPEKAAKGRLSFARIINEVFPTQIGISRLIGDEGWRLKASVEIQSSAVESITVSPLTFAATSVRQPHLERVAPSRHVNQILPTQHISPSPLAKTRGTILHRLLEQIEWFDTFKFDEKHARDIARTAGASSELLTEVLDEFHSLLADKNFCAYLTRPSGVNIEVLRELPFAFRAEDEMIVGAIDRLVVHRNGDRQVVAVEVIDFKSDRFDDSIAAYMERYRPQLDMYVRAVHKMYGVDTDTRAEIISLHSREKVRIW